MGKSTIGSLVIEDLMIDNLIIRLSNYSMENSRLKGD